MPVATVLGAASLLVSAVGVGLSYFGGQSAASTQAAIAESNFRLQSQAASQQQETSQMQSLIAQQMAANEKATMDRNAATLEQQASVNTQAGNENVRRTREDFARMLAAQRAQIGKSGVTDTTGSPLQMLAATATQEQQAIDEQRYQTEQQRRGLFREADNQRAEGRKAEMDIYGAQARGGAASIAAMNALGQAQQDLFASKASAEGMRRQAFGSLLAGIGQLGQNAYQMNWRTPPAKTPRTAMY